MLRFLVAALAVGAATAADLDRCGKSTFEAMLPEEATIQNITSVAKGLEAGEGAENIPYPANPKDLPELCAVTVQVKSSEKSSFRFGLFLPTEWNSRFLAVGNGGFAGGINWLDMGPGAHYGFATASTDTGHNSSVTDIDWALNNEETRIDWGWRAIHGTVDLAKKMAAEYYKDDVKYSYYSGCSTGGRQGLKEMQKFPDSFDGVLVGAPAWNPPILNPMVTQVGIYNLPVNSSHHVNSSMFPVIGKEVVRQCDGLDGVEDGIISSPELCRPDLSKLSCEAEGINKSACLTAPQMKTMEKMYSDMETRSGRFLWPGFLPGSENQWTAVIGKEEPSAFGTNFNRYFVYNEPKWEWRDFNQSLVETSIQRNAGDTKADKYDLSDFKDRGGKMVMYHGMADGLVTTKGTNLYYNRVSERMGGMPTDFFRYFLVPGMQHCWTSAVDAPWNFAGAFQAGALGNDTWSVPGFNNAQHDILLALVDWVEKDKPVDSVIATTWQEVDNSTTPVLRQRPICPYPQKAVYDEEGDVNKAESWACKEVKQEGGGGDDEDTAGGFRPSSIAIAVGVVLCTLFVGY